MAESSARLYDVHAYTHYGLSTKSTKVLIRVFVPQSRRNAAGNYDSEDVLVNVGHRKTNAAQGEGWAGALGMPESGYEDLVEEVPEHGIRATSVRNLRKLKGKKGVRTNHLEHLLQKIGKFLSRLDLQTTGVTPELIELAEETIRVVQRSENLLGGDMGAGIRLALERELTQAKKGCISFGGIGESGSCKSSFINFCTTPKESLSENWEDLGYCPGWLFTAKQRKDVTVLVAGLQYEAGVLYRAVLVPRPVEEYIELVHEIVEQADCPQAVETFGCYWEGNILRLGEDSFENGHMLVRTLLSDPPARNDVFTLEELKEESESSDPVLWNRQLTRLIGERLTAQEMLAAAMQLTTSEKVTLQPRMIFCDLPGFGSIRSAGTSKVEQATLTAIAVKAAAKLDVLVPMSRGRRPDEELLLAIFKRKLLTRTSILMIPILELREQEREEQLNLIVDDATRVVLTFNDTNDGLSRHNIVEYIRILYSEGCINVLDRTEKVQDHAALMRLLCQRKNVKFDQLVADAAFRYLAKLNRSQTKLAHGKPRSKTKEKAKACQMFEGEALDGAFLGSKEDWLSKQRTELQAAARKLKNDETANASKLVGSVAKVLQGLRGDLVAAAMSFFTTRVELLAESFFDGAQDATLKAQRHSFVKNCESEFGRTTNQLLNESAPRLQQLRAAQTALRRLRYEWRHKPESTGAEADPFYDDLVEILFSGFGLMGALYDWADKEVRQLSEVAVTSLRQLASEPVPDQTDESELVILKKLWRALKNARRQLFFRVAIYRNEERDLTEPLPYLKMFGPTPWKSKFELPDRSGKETNGRKRQRAVGASSAHTAQRLVANGRTDAGDETEKHIKVVRRADGAFDFHVGTDALALASAYEETCRTLDPAKETVIVPTFLHLERQLGRPNPYELGLRDPDASLEPQQPRLKKVVATLFLVVVQAELLQKALLEAAKRSDTTVVELPRYPGLKESLEIVKGLAEALFSDVGRPHMPGMYAETIVSTAAVEHLSPKPRMSSRVTPERAILFASECLQRSQKEATAPCLDYLQSHDNHMALNEAADVGNVSRDEEREFLKHLVKSAEISLPAVKAFLQTDFACGLPTLKRHVELCVASVPVIAVAGFSNSNDAIRDLVKRAHSTGCHDITYEFRIPNAFLGVFPIDALRPFSYPATSGKDRRRTTSESMYNLVTGVQHVRAGYYRALEKAGCLLINCCAFALEWNHRRAKPGWHPAPKRGTQEGSQTAGSPVKPEHGNADAGASGSQAEPPPKRARRGQAAANFERGQPSESTGQKAAGPGEPFVKREAAEEPLSQEGPIPLENFERTRDEEDQSPRRQRPGKEVAWPTSPPLPDHASSEDESPIAEHDSDWDPDDEQAGWYSDADDLFGSDGEW